MKLNKSALPKLNENITGTWSFENIKIPAKFGNNFYQQVTFDNNDYILDGVDYTSPAPRTDAFGKMINISDIPAMFIYLNLPIGGQTFVVKYYTTDSFIASKEIIDVPGVYIFQRGITVSVIEQDDNNEYLNDGVSVNKPSYTKLSPFFY
jgi:hypothetical protein